MALSQAAQFALAVALLGCLSFIFGVIAENKKPPFGTPQQMKGFVVCKFPSDPTVGLGALSVVALFLSTVVGLLSVFFPYQGKSVPKEAIFRSTTLVVFFIVALAVFALGEAMMMWATITEGLHRTQNVHYDLSYQCPTAKTGLFGGAAFLALDSSLFWLVCQMLTHNARADYLDEDDAKGEYGEVTAVEFSRSAAAGYDDNGAAPHAGAKV